MKINGFQVVFRKLNKNYITQKNLSACERLSLIDEEL